MIADKPPVLSPDEPSRKRPRKRRREERRGDRCLNCGFSTDTRYCPDCGQENLAVNISIWEIFREAVEEFIRFDSKLLRTLIPLVVSPGKLTQEWSSGRRTRYLSPLKLYLTITALFFLILPYAQSSLDNDGKATKRVVSAERSTSKRAHRISATDEADMPKPVVYMVHQLSKLDGDFDSNTLQNEFANRAPTALFFMLPVFAFVLKVLYIRRQRYYVEHLVFALHIHAYYFLLATAATVLNVVFRKVDFGIFDSAVFLAVPIYSVLAVKRTYGQDWPKTLFKSFMLGFVYVILLGFTLFGCILAAASALPDAPPTTPTTSPQDVKAPTANKEKSSTQKVR